MRVRAWRSFSHLLSYKGQSKVFQYLSWMRSLKFCSFFHPRKLSNFRIVSGFCLFDFLNNQFEKIFHFFCLSENFSKIFFSRNFKDFLLRVFFTTRGKNSYLWPKWPRAGGFSNTEKIPKKFSNSFFQKIRVYKKSSFFHKNFSPFKKLGWKIKDISFHEFSKLPIQRKKAFLLGDWSSWFSSSPNSSILRKMAYLKDLEPSKPHFFSQWLSARKPFEPNWGDTKSHHWCPFWSFLGEFGVILNLWSELWVKESGTFWWKISFVSPFWRGKQSAHSKNVGNSKEIAKTAENCMYG